MTPHVQGGGQLKDDVRQRRMLQQLVRRQRGLAARPHVPPAKAAVQAQDHITEDEAEDQGAQEVVAKELHIGGVYGEEDISTNSQKVLR